MGCNGRRRTWPDRPHAAVTAWSRWATRIVLFGGLGASNDFCDTWEWDGTSWTDMNATLTTGFHCNGHAIASLGDTIYLFGGVAAGSDTWAYDGASWTQVSTVGPVGRAFASMTTYGDKIVLFGGEEDANHILNDTWEWDGSTWTERSVAGPPPRWHAGMAPFAGKLVLFGGDSGSGWLGDTWRWDGSNWAQASAAGPPARYAYTLASR